MSYLRPKDEFPLHLACYRGDKDKVDQLLKKNFNPNQTDSEGNTALHFACRHGHLECVKLLIDNGAIVNAESITKLTPLHWACERGHLACAELLLIENGADANAVDNDKWTPLHIACFDGKLECVKLLIDNGANVNAETTNKWTPLHWACERGHFECVELLLKHGANINAVDNNKWTPLHRACLGGHLECAELLLKFGANANPVDNNKWTPLHWACERGHLECVKLLIDNGANINAVDNNKRTPLHYASYTGHLECVKLLIDNGANANAETTNKWTPLHIACRDGHSRCTELLLDNGANVNAETIDKLTPLHWACLNGHLECAMLLLLKNDVNVIAEAIDKATPLHWACLNGHSTCSELLLEFGANVDAETITKWAPLHCACLNGHSTCSELLLEFGANVDAETITKWAPLHCACLNRCEKCYEIMLKHDISMTFENFNTMVILHSTFNCFDSLHLKDKNEKNVKIDPSWAHSENRKNEIECVRLLLFFGANVDAKEESNLTPLHAASIHGYFDAVKFLLNAGANVNDIHKTKSTALHYASMHGHVEIVEELLKNGADTTAKNDCNSTAWDLAVKYGYGDKLPMLKGALPNLSQKAQFYEINVRGYIFKVPSRYKNVEHCEKGGYGRVATAIDDLTEKEKDVVIKRVPIDFSEELPEKNVYREFMLLKIIKHPNIISLLNAYTPDINVDSFDTVYFVMPFVTSTLSSRLGPSNEQFKNDAVLEIIYKLLCGLKYMHMFGIVHRDLNPRNIGISENGEPIIFDLGLSRAETENFITNRVGTYSYMAPEIFLGIKIKSFVHMVKSDIWSLACIWIEMITRDHFIDNRGKPPHEYWFRILEKLGTPDGKFMNKIPNLDLRAYYQALSKYEAKSPSELIPAKKFHVFVQDDEEHINAVQQTISTMLKFDPEQRVSAQDLVDKFERMNWVVKQEFNVEKIEIKHFKETCKEARENPELWKDMLFNSLEEYKIKNDVFGGK